MQHHLGQNEEDDTPYRWAKGKATKLNHTLEEGAPINWGKVKKERVRLAYNKRNDKRLRKKNATQIYYMARREPEKVFNTKTLQFELPTPLGFAG
jgi:hypothetical protein